MIQHRSVRGFLSILGLLVFSAFALAADSPIWQATDKLVQEQKFQAALDEVLKVRKSAEAAGNVALVAEARVRAAQLQIGLHGYETAVRAFIDDPWPKAPQARILLHLYYAHALMNYHEQYSWEIRQREKTASDGKPAPKAGVDLKAWTTEDIGREISRNFDEVMKLGEANGLLDKKVPEFLAGYVSANSYPANVRSTFRDLVVYMVVDHFSNQQYWTPSESNEVYKLKIEELARRPAQKRNDASGATVHPLVKMASWLAEHAAFHTRGGRSEAAYEAHYERLSALHTAFSDDDDRAVVRSALRELQNSAKPGPWWARGQFYLATFISAESRPGRLIEARDELKKAIAAFPGGFATKFCERMLFDIEAPQYSLAAMKTDSLGRKSIVVQYKNLRKLYFRAYPVDIEKRLASAIRGDLFAVDDLSGLINGATKPVDSWSVDLPATPDFATHQIFVAPPTKKLGTYIVVASVRQEFSGKNNAVNALRWTASNMVVSTTTQSPKLEVRVLSSDLGQPVAGAAVMLYRFRWDRPAELVATEKTDATGTFVLSEPAKATNEYWNYVLAVRKGEDAVYDNESVYFHPKYAAPKQDAAFIYTDRSIYRPGQKILWKVIGYSGNSEEAKYEVANKGVSVVLSLTDLNGKLVEQKTVAYNEFGSASGEFAIPPGRPLGAWQIRSSPYLGGTSIRVEEYKRPTFLASLDEPKTPARINKLLKLGGDAKYYFGQPLTAAKVKWRVTRSPVLPWWGWWYWWGPSASKAQVVANGEAKLAADGRFDFEFMPMADERLVKKTPGTTFNFAVDVDVVDEGGETRSVARTYRLGSVAVETRLTWKPGFFEAGKPISIQAERVSLNGKPMAGAGQFKIVRLKMPEKALLPSELPRDPNSNAYMRYGGGDKAADIEKYGTPDDKRRARWETEFAWETIASEWPEAGEIASGKLVHGADGQAEIKVAAGSAGGLYRVIYETKDDFGSVYTAKKDFVVAAEKAGPALPLTVLAETASVEVGGKARIFVHSQLPDQQLTLEMYKAGQRLWRRPFQAGKDRSLIEIPVTTAERGGFVFVAYGVRDHQWVRKEIPIAVPWTDREIKLEFSTFRDTIRPGTKETFRLMVKGEKTTVGAMEVLSYMYDKSLDTFAPHFAPSLMRLYPSRAVGSSNRPYLGSVQGWFVSGNYDSGPSVPNLRPDVLNFHQNYAIGGMGRRYRGKMYKEEMVMMSSMPATAPPEDAVGNVVGAAKSVERRQSGMMAEADGAPMPESKRKDVVGKADTADKASDTGAPVEMRSNFAETAFFKPHLVVAADGTTGMEFQVPDSVTTWNVLAHAFTRDLRGGSVRRETKSVKELMVRPYVPRFLRENDAAVIKVMVNNTGTTEAAGQVTFDIEDPETGKSVLPEFGLSVAQATKPFTTARSGSTTVEYRIVAPKRVGSFVFKVIAKSKTYSDGESRPFPVLPSRMHLVQSKFAALRNKDRKVLEFVDLAKSTDAKGGDPTLINEKMVVTIDAQLFYGVLQSLPYMLNYPYACAEQTMNRFLTSGLVTSLFDRYPAVAKMAKEFSARKEQFERFDEPDANRRMTLEESPWLEMAEGGRKANFEMINVLDQRVAKADRDNSLAKLRKMQLPSGAFPWFDGGPPDRYMTLYVLLGLSRAFEFAPGDPTPMGLDKNMVTNAWRYIRGWLDSDLQEIMRTKCCSEFVTLVNFAISQYPDASWGGSLFDDAYRKRMADYSFTFWKEHAPLLKAYLALTLKRMGRASEAKLVWDSVMDSAKTDAQLGTYWAPEDRAWLWYNDTVETQAFALRALMELAPEDKRTDGLAQWLFLNKKLNHWKSTKATAEAIYGLSYYLTKSTGIEVREAISVDIGNQKTNFVFEPGKYTGKKNQVVVPGSKVDSKTSSKIVVEKSSPGLAFASATWHFSTDQLPKEDRGDFFQVSRRYFKRVNDGKQWTIKALAAGEKIAIGDQIEVQISLRTKHEAEYVHLRDPRAAGLEPENQVSGYKWDLGINWYEETRDSGTNFFFSKLPVGEYTLKYRVRANMAGTFRIGPAEVQSVYAPEFNSYSAGAVMTIN